MSKQDLKKKANRTWDTVNLFAAAVGGALLTFTADTPVLFRSITVGQLVGAVLLSTVAFRIAHLIHSEER